MVIKSGLSMCFAALSHGLKSTRSSSPSGRRGASAHLRPIPPRRRPATQPPSAPALSCRGRRRRARAATNPSRTFERQHCNMLGHAWHGGPFVEVFSAQGSKSEVGYAWVSALELARSWL